jgi:hypothetical protein
MSTVAILSLLSNDDPSIQRVNQELSELGFNSEIYDDIRYGPFPCMDHLTSYSQWLNTDPIGQTEISHFERPITTDFLQSFPWYQIGCYYVTLNGLSPQEISQYSIVYNFAFNHQDLFDWSRSNTSQQLLNQFGFNF